MTDWPVQAYVEAGPTLHSGSLESLGPDLFGSGTSLVNCVSAVFPAAGRAYCFPFYNLGQRNVVVQSLFWFNGAAVSGNVDFGLYDAKFRRIVSTGAVAQAGINALQIVAAAASLPPGGPYHFAVAMDNIVGTLMRTSPFTGVLYLAGAFMALTAFPLPATLTPQFGTANYYPLVGLSQRSFV